MIAATRASVPILSAATGLHLDSYRADHVDERVRRALERERVEGVDELARLFRRDPAARSRFRRSIAVSVSGLFRDPAQFELLEHEILPALLESRRRIRVWSAGCADGTELYTVTELLERLDALDRAFLLGSDVLEENLERARRGVYPDATIDDAVRVRVRWERRDVVREGAPSGSWNLVLCRNVAIYLAPAVKHMLHALLADALTLGGVLLLGRSERLAEPTTLGLDRVAPHAYRKVA